MAEDDTRHRTTSTSVPRFEIGDARGRQWSLKGLSSPAKAVRFFRIALGLGAATAEDVREWALAYSKSSSRVPEWVWDVLDPAVPVDQALRDKDPVDPADANVRAELEVLEAAVRAGTLAPEVALARIHDRKWRGDLEWHDPHTGARTPEGAAAHALADAWAKEKLHREVERGQASPSWPDLDARLRAFLSRFRLAA